MHILRGLCLSTLHALVPTAVQYQVTIGHTTTLLLLCTGKVVLEQAYTRNAGRSTSVVVVCLSQHVTRCLSQVYLSDESSSHDQVGGALHCDFELRYHAHTRCTTYHSSYVTYYTPRRLGCRRTTYELVPGFGRVAYDGPAKQY